MKHVLFSKVTEMVDSRVFESMNTRNFRHAVMAAYPQVRRVMSVTRLTTDNVTPMTP